MNVGTKSLLWGVHAGWFHPITVLIAWIELYGLPNWKECICIFIHDWGYLGCADMDGEDGKNHPNAGAQLAQKWFDSRRWVKSQITENYYYQEIYGNHYYYLCLLHSRHYAKRYGLKPSKLCWADKLSIKYDPWWFYLLRAKASGEIKELRKHSDDFGELKYDKTNREWYKWAHDRMIRKALTQDATPPFEGH